MKKRTTINDVAREANVSISTVSRVLNHQHTGAYDVRDRVLRAAETLDYRHSGTTREVAARSGGRSMSFVLDTSMPFGTFMGDIFYGAEDEARRCGFELYFSTTDSQLAVLATGSMPRGIAGDTVKGMIYTGLFPGNFYPQVKKVGIPVIHVSHYPPGEVVDCVMCNNFTASYQAVNWLVGLGHRRIACIACQAAINTSIAERVMGYQQALFEAGITPEAGWLQSTDGYNPEDGYAAMESLLQLPERPTAVFGTVDEIAVGALQCARASGLQIPRDLSILGMNDLEMTRICDPPLTTIRIFREDMGRMAVRHLMERLQHPHERPKRIDVLCEMVQRGSCCSPLKKQECI